MFILILFVEQLIKEREDEYQVMKENKAKDLEKIFCSKCIVEREEYVEEIREELIEQQKKKLKQIRKNEI